MFCGRWVTIPMTHRIRDWSQDGRRKRAAKVLRWQEKKRDSRTHNDRRKIDEARSQAVLRKRTHDHKKSEG